MLYLALLYYGFGVGMLESLMNYPMWKDFGARMTNADFIATRNGDLWRVFPLLVIPEAARVPVTLALLWLRPVFVPRWVPPFALAMQAILWLSSATIQIPIQLTLNADGFSNELFDRLIATDLWLRVLPLTTEVAVSGFIIWRIVGRLTTSTASTQTEG